ncbi:hypothetical protein FQZ97_468040 [compost metagenome]
MGALVDRVEAVVAVVLLDRVFAGVAVAAEDLDGQLVGLQAELRGPGLDDRGEQVEQLQRLLARAVVGQGLVVVDQARGVQAEVEGALDVGLLRQQHAAHVGVLDDRHLRRGWVLAVRQAALRALAGVFQGIEVAGVAEHDRGHADADARAVHHLEHVRQALVRLADQVADALAVVAEVQRGGSGAAPAHLVEQAGEDHVVARAQRAVGVDQELRHDEQADALHPGRGVRQPGQHHVHDVLAQRVIAAGDEDLVALDPVAAVGVRFGAGAQVRQRRAGVRLGQRHGAEEAALDHRLQEQALLLVGAEGFDQVAGAEAQRGVRGGGHVGGLEVRVAGLRQQVRQLHAADLEVARGIQETGLDEGVDRRLDLGDQLRRAVHVLRLVLVVLAIVRGEQLLGDAPRGADGGLEGLAAVVGEALALGEGFGVEHFVEFEGQVAGAEQGLGHGRISVVMQRSLGW